MTVALQIGLLPRDCFVDRRGRVTRCPVCERPLDMWAGPAAFAGERLVCDPCAAERDPALAKRLWQIRAELDRSRSGPATENSIDELDASNERWVRAWIRWRVL